MSATIGSLWINDDDYSVFLVTGICDDPPVATGLISLERSMWDAYSGIFVEQAALVSYLQESCKEIKKDNREYPRYLASFVARYDRAIAQLSQDLEFLQHLKRTVEAISGTQPTEEPK